MAAAREAPASCDHSNRLRRGLERRGSRLTCWMRSTVVARSMATRGKVLGAVIFFLMRSPCCMSWLSLLETSCTASVSKASSAHWLSDVPS